MYVDAAQSVSVRGLTQLEHNSALDGFGGGFYVARATSLSIEGASFMSNVASFGGAVATFSSGQPVQPIMYSSCTFSNNSAAEDGGGIYSVACYDDLRDLSMSGNLAGAFFFVVPTRYNVPV